MDGSVNRNGVGEISGVSGEMGFTVGTTAVGNTTVETKKGISVGVAICVSVTAVPTVDMAVSITSVGLVVGVDMKLLQDASITAARNKGINVLPKIFTFQLPCVGTGF